MISSNAKSALVVFGIFMVIASTSLLRPLLAKDEIIPWRADLAAAQKESSESGKPVFAYFTASWCGPCQSLKGTTWADKSVDAAMGSYVPVKIDVDKNKALARQYGINTVPTFLVLTADGAPLRQTGGALPPSDMVKWLKGP